MLTVDVNRFFFDVKKAIDSADMIMAKYQKQLYTIHQWVILYHVDINLIS